MKSTVAMYVHTYNAHLLVQYRTLLREHPCRRLPCCIGEYVGNVTLLAIGAARPELDVASPSVLLCRTKS